MSWFADIAGKAEDFLNKIDKNAAVALNTSKDDKKLHTGANGNSNFESSTLLTLSSDVGKSSASSNGSVTRDCDTGGFGGIRSTLTTETSTSNRMGNSRPKPPRKSLQKKIDSPSSANSISNGMLSSSSKTDEELLTFLNTREQREIDEVTLLKNEVATQAKEMGLLLKNHKKLQQEYEDVKKAWEVSKTSSTPYFNQNNDNQTNCLEEKNEEISRLRDRLDQALTQLEHLGEFQSLKNNLEQTQLENKKLTSNQNELIEKLSSVDKECEALNKQVHFLKESLANAEREHSSYKEKAKNILKDKDSMILRLKESGDKSGDVSQEGFSQDTQLFVEMESLKNERELLNAEISQTRGAIDVLKDDVNRLESEVSCFRGDNSHLKDQLKKERSICHSLQEDNLQMSQQISGFQLELERERTDRHKANERHEKLKLDFEQRQSSSVDYQQRTSLSTRQSPVPYGTDITDDNENLRTRISALSQSLLEKQSIVNNLSADKQLLQIRVERLQSQLQVMSQSIESVDNGGLTHTVVANQPLYLSESPWDSRMTTKVKRVYSRMDSFCCQIGVALRQRPNLRLGFSAYIICLHLWVFFILFSWAHHSSLPDDT